MHFASHATQQFMARVPRFGRVQPDSPARSRPLVDVLILAGIRGDHAYRHDGDPRQDEARDDLVNAGTAHERGAPAQRDPDHDRGGAHHHIVATIAEVAVNRSDGHIKVKRLVCAHDCGLVINPAGLEQIVECPMMHGLSRALWEEVRFDTERVTSVDWASHPSLRHSDTPDSIEIVIVNGDPNPDRPDLPVYGAGEGSHKPMIAAIANAVHDATGVRLRQVPFRKERVLEALRGRDA